MYKTIFLILICNILIFSNSLIYTQKNSDDLLKSQNKLKVELQLLQKKHKSDITDLKVQLEQNKAHTDSLVLDAKLKNQKDIFSVKSLSEKNSSTLRKDYNELLSINEKHEYYTLLFGIFSVLLLILTALIGLRLFALRRLIDKLENDNQIKQNQITQLTTNSSENLSLVIDKIAAMSNNIKKDVEPDHSMVIELVKHITTIENNMSRMDPNDRGLARIKRAIENMYNSLKSMDYEITLLMGKQINVGEIIEIERSEPDDSIETGKKIVFNVVRAEILFKGKQIQRAKVDVKYNPNN